MTPSQKARKRSASPKRPPRDRYEDAALNRCIRRTSEKAGTPQVPVYNCVMPPEPKPEVLAVDWMGSTQVYAEVSREKVAELALELG